VDPLPPITAAPPKSVGIAVERGGPVAANHSRAAEIAIGVAVVGFERDRRAALPCTRSVMQVHVHQLRERIARVVGIGHAVGVDHLRTGDVLNQLRVFPVLIDGYIDLRIGRGDQRDLRLRRLRRGRAPGEVGHMNNVALFTYVVESRDSVSHNEVRFIRGDYFIRPEFRYEYVAGSNCYMG
jgi:hypothetical protein